MACPNCNGCREGRDGCAQRAHMALHRDDGGEISSLTAIEMAA